MGKPLHEFIEEVYKNDPSSFSSFLMEGTRVFRKNFVQSLLNSPVFGNAINIILVHLTTDDPKASVD